MAGNGILRCVETYRIVSVSLSPQSSGHAPLYRHVAAALIHQYWDLFFRAVRRGSGIFTPLLTALSRIPRQVLGLKKYFCGRSPVSKISNKEDSTTLLGYSEVFSVKDAVGPPIPDLSQRPDDGTKVPSSVCAKNSGDVLPDDPLWSELLSDKAKYKSEVSSCIFKTCSESCNREGLTGRSSDQYINTG